MLCPNCGQEIETNSKFCAECGAPQTLPPPAAPVSPEPASPAPPNQERLRAERAAYVRQDYDPARDGKPSAANQPANRSVPPAAAFPAAPGYPPPAWANPLAPAEQRPATTGIIIFSIINMLCCGLGIGFILGVIALIFAIMAASEQNLTEARHKLSTARTINLVGLVFIILQVVCFFVFFGVILLATRS